MATPTNGVAAPAAGGFFQTAVGHAVIAIVVSAASAIVSALVNDHTLAADLGVGGTLAAAIKLIVDLIRPGIANI